MEGNLTPCSWQKKKGKKEKYHFRKEKRKKEKGEKKKWVGNEEMNSNRCSVLYSLFGIFNGILRCSFWGIPLCRIHVNWTLFFLPALWKHSFLGSNKMVSQILRCGEQNTGHRPLPEDPSRRWWLIPLISHFFHGWERQNLVLLATRERIRKGKRSEEKEREAKKRKEKRRKGRKGERR